MISDRIVFLMFVLVTLLHYLVATVNIVDVQVPCHLKLILSLNIVLSVIIIIFAIFRGLLQLPIMFLGDTF